MKFYKNLIVGWAIFYFAVAIVGRTYTHKKEIYPFFRWSLYSKTPNNLVYPFVMVSKVGDSVLPKPINILELYSIHKIALTDINLMVNNFYNDTADLDNSLDSYQGVFFRVLPMSSEYTLYIKKLDLSKLNYKQTESLVQVLEVKDNKITFFEGNN